MWFGNRNGWPEVEGIVFWTVAWGVMLTAPVTVMWFVTVCVVVCCWAAPPTSHTGVRCSGCSNSPPHTSQVQATRTLFFYILTSCTWFHNLKYILLYLFMVYLVTSLYTIMLIINISYLYCYIILMKELLLKFYHNFPYMYIKNKKTFRFGQPSPQSKQIKCISTWDFTFFPSLWFCLGNDQVP